MAAANGTFGLDLWFDNRRFYGLWRLGGMRSDLIIPSNPIIHKLP